MWATQKNNRAIKISQIQKKSHIFSTISDDRPHAFEQKKNIFDNVSI